MPTTELRVRNICQGYFCHHREFNNDVMRKQQRCFAICMSCAQNPGIVVDYGDADYAGFEGKFTDSEYGPPTGIDAKTLDSISAASETGSMKIRDDTLGVIGTWPAFVARHRYLPADKIDIVKAAEEKKLSLIKQSRESVEAVARAEHELQHNTKVLQQAMVNDEGIVALKLEMAVLRNAIATATIQFEKDLKADEVREEDRPEMPVRFTPPDGVETQLPLDEVEEKLTELQAKVGEAIKNLDEFKKKVEASKVLRAKKEAKKESEK